MGYVNDTELVKDLAQETFVIVWNKLSEFRNESTIDTWIYRITSNTCLRQIEQQKRFPRDELPTDLVIENEPDVESKTTFLYKCIAELHEIDRLIISLELENVKQEEIASILGLSKTNVRVKIHRIKEKLMEKFKKYHE
ncbi:DNA-directed RNA polymerase sigma-70 factor [Mongoliitalea lutea]|uniref:DNA-directed RNA polymerase sigma-70 factor n=2 Tax=Mongoliitalea lutea TaxID=849756 RepID=A0A8J3G4N2_9BACT|nr:DNA-directed RNA polymerase sigma-70 factor [Mongoliitalea lutea]